jgi:hypothetical protein
MNKLKGLPSAHAVRQSAWLERPAPFQADSYTRVTSASTEELLHSVPTVVERLLGDLARGLGLRNYLFPYTEFKEIGQRVARRW